MPLRRPRNLRRVKDSSTSWENNSNLEPTAAIPQFLSTPAQNTVSTASSLLSSPQPTNEPASNTSAVALEDLLEFQKYRRQKRHGIDVDALAKGERRKKQAKSEPVWNGEEDEEEEGGRKAARSLDGAFTAQTNKLDANKHMMAYIEQEMSRNRGTDALGGDVKEQAAKDRYAQNNRAADDDPYRLPDHLKVLEDKPVSEGNVAMAAKMLTSIQEVDLGAESRATNIRETNKVVLQLGQGAAAHNSTSGHSGGSIDSTDSHSLLMMQHGSGSRFRKHHAEMNDRSSKATDDIVLQRFKKRMRR
ncbi:hypothetical protein GGI25_005336 [Coemansia spiralis]|uniref:Hepatocellular carcinoma-associated antigen 59-domain-containing protein n=2 Tax=Coemansia TaxID=4863 RepID=A0A9W8KUR9_9FUNG|nr:hepatocellular carcinoma-associated antigen 59-domain-containing protein [Coemansia spiralis]KAJ1988830.1 hypothetical protein EDC05_005057 [Coemansia umbellata]KAJ2619710.1 hypothetical protein GGI26_005611 [Coemansia sp. RSA 1358]KAJ2671837.1 hypothetical protein GGI25_005336 [Coemansia spiralis]